MSQSAANQGGKGAPERILVVDDNEPGRYAKMRILRRAGYAVVEAGSGVEALRAVTEDAPDLVLLDVGLPDINGFEVCRRIKADLRTTTIPVLQISATTGDDRSKIAGLESGADGYLAEPVEPSLLVATVAAFLRTRRAEDAMREYALEWKTTFDAISDGVALVDTAGRIVRSNRALAALLNSSAAELNGAPIDGFFPPSGFAVDWSRLESGCREDLECSRGDRTFAVAVDPVTGEQGRIRGAVCILSDITERKLMNERLWHTQKLESIGLLAGGVAHDFNNILTGILGNASLALEAPTDADSTARALRDIERAAERAADLTRQLLAYAGKGRFVVRPLDLSRLIDEVLPLARVAYSPKIKLVLRLGKGLPAIEADKTQLEQIVMNLLINSGEAIGDQPGNVTVTTRALRFDEDQRRRYISDREVTGDYVMLEVRDSGMGMDPETTRRIFDPFFTTKFMGRGLGLSAVLGIVRSHKGAIRVTSAPGQGARFELLFPAVSRPAPVEEPAARPGKYRRARSAGTVLVVDDEAIVRDFFQAALRADGYDVVLARNGAEAVRIFGQDPDRFSLVVLDMIMPVMSGKEALPRLFDIRPDARVVITSGQMEEEVRRDLGDARLAGFIQKPCAAGALIEQVRTLSRKSGGTPAGRELSKRA